MTFWARHLEHDRQTILLPHMLSGEGESPNSLFIGGIPERVMGYILFVKT